MKEQIKSPITNLEFHRYFNRILYNFSPSEKKIERDYEPRECNLLFMVNYFSCNYALVFENNQFFFKLNFEISDNQHLDLRNEFYKKLYFLISDHRFFSRDENSIVLKSQIDEKLIERAHIIFATERWMNSYFFPETKVAMEEIISIIFEEFKEIMHQVWKTIFENFETVNSPNLTESSQNLPKDYLPDIENENIYNLPTIIKIYFDSFQKQKFEQRNRNLIILKKKKNWIKKIYIFIKKLKTNKNYKNFKANNYGTKINYKN